MVSHAVETHRTACTACLLWLRRRDVVVRRRVPVPLHSHLPCSGGHTVWAVVVQLYIGTLLLARYYGDVSGQRGAALHMLARAGNI